MKKLFHKKALSVVTAMVLTVLLLSVTACSKEASGSLAADREAQTITEGQNLVIPISELSETARFYPVRVNGTEMEIIAVRDGNGTIRTAFNTCQICYDSGRGYYEQEGNALVCQNCGNRFTIAQIEVAAGGCNPYPIFDSDKTVTADCILIAYDFLEASRKIFLNWKSSY